MLGRGGEHDYRVFLPTIVEDVDGLPAEVLTEYAASRTTPGRLAAMARGTLRGGPIRRYRRARPAALPLSVMIPRVEPLRSRPCSTSSTRSCPSSSHGRSVPTGRRSTVDGAPQQARDHDLRARGRDAEERLDPRRARPSDSPDRPRPLPPRRRAPRRSCSTRRGRGRNKNHARLFEAFSLLRRERPEPGSCSPAAAPSRCRPGRVSRRVERSRRTSSSRLYRRAACVAFPSLYEGFGSRRSRRWRADALVACSGRRLAAGGAATPHGSSTRARRR